jgi:hypothetical protein
MSIGPVSSTFQVPGDPSAMGSYLTPDALMTYCQTRLQGLDTQMNSIFTQQQKMNSESQTLTDLLANPAFELPTDEDLGDAGKTKQALQHVDLAIQVAEGKLNPNDPHDAALIKKLEEFRQSLFDGQGNPNPALLNGSDHMTSEQFNSAIIGKISGMQKDLSSGAELNMISLQSIMSQRQEAIQLATSLVQSLGDQCNKIADNVGK